MAYVITDAKFSRDSYSIRSTSLNFISANIDDFAVENNGDLEKHEKSVAFVLSIIEE